MQTKKMIGGGILLLLVIITAAIYFWPAGHAEEEAPAVISPPVSLHLIQRAEDEVAEITFHTADSSASLIRYYDEFNQIQWYYTGASGYQLNPAQRRNKARPAWLLTALEIIHEDASGLDLAQFGLYPPTLTMVVLFDDGDEYTVHLGTRTVDLQNYFLMIEGGPAMYLISGFVGERMKLGLEDMLDMSLPSFNAENMQYLRLTRQDRPDIILYADEYNRLRVAEPYTGVLLDYWALGEMLMPALTHLRMTELVELHAYDPAAFGFDEPILEIEYRGEFDEVHLLFGDIFIYDEIEFIYAKFAGRPHIFKLESGTVDLFLNMSILDIIQRFIALVNIHEVEKVVIDAPASEQRFEMVFNHSLYDNSMHPTLNGTNMEEPVIRDLYRQLISLRAEVEIPAFTPQGVPDITITYHRFDYPDIELRFFRFDANFYAVSVDGRDAWFVTNNRDVSLLLQELSAMTW